MAEMNNPQLQGTIQRIEGTAWRKLPDGQMVVLRPGDHINAGDIIVTGPNTHMELARSSGAPVDIGPDRTLLADQDVLGQSAPDKAEAAILPLDADADRVIAALNAGQDPFAVLEAPAAGLTAGGQDSGHSFVQLLRIVEEVTPFTGETRSVAGATDQLIPPVGGSDGLATQDEAPQPESPPAPSVVVPTSTGIVLSGSANTVSEGGSIVYTATTASPVTGTPLVITLNSGVTITIPVGASSASSTPVAVRADDAYAQGDETITTRITSTSGGGFDQYETGTPVTTVVRDDADATTASLSATASTSEGGSIVYTATLTGSAATPVTITLSNGASITIAAGSSSGSVSVPAPANDVYANGTSVSATITGTTGGGFENLVANSAPATTLITDTVDTTIVTLSAPANALEGAGVVYTASVNHPVTGSPLVLTLSNGTTITIPVGSSTASSAPVVLRADDVLMQGTSLVPVSITAHSGGNFEALDTSSNTTTSVTDDSDATSVSLTATPTVAEGGNITYTATLSSAGTTPVTVTLNSGAVITIAAGQLTGSATVAAPADDAYVDAGSVSDFIRTVTGGGFENLVASSTPVSTSVTDTLNTTTVTLTQSAASVAEGGAVTYTATVDHQVTGSPLVVTLSNGQTITIPVGASSASAPAYTPRADDVYVQGAGSIVVSIAGTSGANYEALTTTSTVTTTITEDSDATTVTLTQSAASVVEGGTVTYTATVDHQVTGTPLVVTLSNGQTISIPVGATSASAPAYIARADDAYVQGADSTVVSITGTSGANFEALDTTSTVTTAITEDSDATTVTLTQSAASVVEGGAVTYTATVGHQVTGSPLVVTLSNGQTITIPVGATSASAPAYIARADDAYVQGADSTVVSITGTSGANFEALDTTSTVTTAITEDSDATTVTLTQSAASVVEGGSVTYTATVDHQVTGSPLVVTLSNGQTITIPVGASSASAPAYIPRADDVYAQGAVSTVVGIAGTSGGNFEALNTSSTVSTTVTDDADVTTASISGPASVAEGAAANYTVSLSNQADTSVTIQLAYSGTASNGTDFSGVASVTIPAGASSQSFNISAITDGLAEGSESFTISLASPTGGNFENLVLAAPGAGGSVTTQIIDGDASSVSLSATSALSEAGGTITYTATLTQAPVSPLTVTLSNGATISIAAGAFSGSVDVPLASRDDAYVETDSVSATISGTSGGGIGIAIDPAPAVTIITDTLDTTTVTLSAPASVVEGGAITYTASVDHAVTGSPLVLTLSNGATITIPVGASSATSAPVAVRADDAYAQGSVAAPVSITAHSGGNFEALDTTSTTSTTVTDDNDITTVSLSATPAVAEGGAIVYTASLTSPADTPVTVTLSNGATIIIAAGTSSGTVSVTAPGDDAYVDAAPVSATILTATGGNFENLLINPAAASTSVTDTIDTTTITLTATADVNEGGSITYTASVDHVVTGTPLIITLSNNLTITIPVGASSASSAPYNVRGDDAYLQGNETLNVGITGTSGGNYEALNTASTVSTVVHDDSDATIVTLTASAAHVNEGGSIIYTASVDHAVTGAPLQITLSNGQTITIAAGATSGSSAPYAISIDDINIHADHTLPVSVASVTGGNFEALDIASSTATTQVNFAPETGAVNASGNEDTSVTVTLSGTDTDGTVSTYVIGSTPDHGTLYRDAALTQALNAGDTVSGNTVYFKPDANWNGSAGFQYAAQDNDGVVDSTPATATITVNPVNDAPVAHTDVATTPINTPLTNINVLSNDVDVDGDSLSVTSASVPSAQGTVSVNPDGTLNFTPASNYTGSATISYAISDGHGGTSNTTLTINVGANTPPDSANALITTSEDTSVALTSAQFAFSDSDAGQTLNAVRIDGLPTAGTLTLDGSPVSAGAVISIADINAGLLVFTPAANANGNAYANLSFSVQDSAGAFDPSPNTLTINVTPVADAAVIGGVDTGATREDLTTSASGTLTISDPDAGEAAFVAQTSIAGAHGSFSVDISGNWTYTLNNGDAAVQALGAGQNLPAETFQVQSLDGSTHTVTVSITGTNDAAVITPAVSNITETNAVLTTGGTLAISDIDSPATFVAQTNAAGTNGYGQFSVNTDGTWTYATNTAHNEFVAGNTYTDTLTVTSADGTTSTITVNILGTNDAAMITPAVANLTETDAALTTSGTLAISDVDSPAAFVAQTNVTGSNGFGQFTLGSNGAWTYTTNTAHNEFAAGATYTDTLTVTSADGTTSTITVNILGTNDAAVISPAVANLTETNAVLTTGGTLAISDVDSPATFIAQTNVAGSSAYGHFTLGSNGVWTYTADTAHNEFIAGTTYTDTLTVTSADGTTSTITVNILGTNDAAVITPAVANLTETNAALTTGGTLAITDVDSPATFVAQTNVAGSSAYGHFTLGTNGAWTYTADTAHNEFVAGNTYTDTLTVTSADGTTSTITVNILGTNDAAVISPAVANLTETDAALTTSGTLAISDVDSPATFVAQNNVAGSNAYGHFTLGTNGVWTYTADTAHNEFVAGSTYTDTLTVTSADGTTSTITVNILGTNDAAVISPAVANLTETNAALTTGGTLTITDVDSPATFIAQTNVAGSNAYGHFTLGSNGAWTYTADTAHNEFVAGSTYTDTLTVTSADGTTSTITVNILGTNDAAVISPAVVNLTETNTVLTTGGTLAISDVDSAATFVAQTNVAGSNAYGHFTLGSNGAWTYTADTAHNEFVTGSTYTDTLTVTSADGTTSTITVNILGTNDAAVITPAVANLTETNAVLTTGGTLAISDVDSPATFQAQTNVAGSNGYGNFTVNADGSWTYTANTAHNEFVAGTTYTDTLSVTSADGTVSSITVNILGTNDVPTFGGASTGSVVEAGGLNNAAAGTPTASGTLTISDADAAQSSFEPPASLAGTYGNFTFNTGTGAWTYVLDNSRPATQALTAGATVHDTLSVTSSDGSASKVIDITVTGSNDNASITGTSTGSMTEDTALTSGNLTAAGTLAVSDVDAGQATFATPATLAGTYGNFTFDAATGAWTYAASNAQPAIQSLGAGQTLTDTIVVNSADGSASQSITVTIHGTTDSAVIGGTATGTVTEDAAISGGNISVSGALTVSDVDAGEASFATPATLTGTYGSFSFDTATGAWTYTADNAQTAIQQLGAGQSLTDSIVIKSLDGSASQTITVTLNGTNDIATISGSSTAAVTEDASVTAGNLTASGSLSVADVDLGQNSFAAPATLSGAYGNFTFNAATGAWTYAADNSQSAIQSLGAGQSLTDSIVVKSLDGSASQTITVTINGNNDAAVIGGTATGTVFEDTAVTSGKLTASGSLTVADVDAGQATFAAPASLAGSYGNFTFDTATGAWTYAADNAQTAIQQLGVGQSLTDTIVVKSLDGTASQTITVTINGTNDVAIIGGTATGTVTEDTAISGGNISASGALTIVDADLGQAGFATPASLTGAYGSFSFDTATGAWTYAADNAQTAIQQLGVGQSLTDSIVVQSLDGSASQTITVTLNGTNDIATITGSSTAAVTEDANVTSGNLSASGSLSVADVDLGQNTFAAPATLAGSYGNFTFDTATGTWTYAASNAQSAIQSLGAGQSLTDSIVVTSLDGTASQTITVTINGTNDVAIVGGTSTANVIEAGGINNATPGTASASGALTILDTDSGQSSFTAPPSLTGTYGNFTFNASTGAWTYALDNSRSATQALTAGSTVHDTLTVTSTDGSATKIIDVTVTGSNDNASITGTSTGSMTEDAALTSGNLTASGTLTVADVDAGQATFAAPATLAGTYGNFTFDAVTGAWSYTASNAQPAIQSLGAGQSLTDTIVVNSADGSASQSITVTIHGANDVAVIGGTAIGTMTEDTAVSAGNLVASGTLAASDVDAGEASFATPATLAGTYGDFTFDTSSGAWTYAANNTQTAVQQLGASQSLTDSIIVKSLDGTASQIITVTINGTNDVATISGTSSAAVTEDMSVVGGKLTAGGTLAVSDVDAGQASFATPATLAGAYGNFTFNAATGAWTYAADNSQSAIQSLGAGQSLTDSIVVTSLDGTASQTITVTINGTNDAAVIGGTSTGSVVEAGGLNNATAGTPTASGTLTISDADAGQSNFTAPPSLTGTYGNFTFNASTGAWTYALDNSKAATQALTAGTTVHDTLTVTSSDGTATQLIDVTVAGANDNATITGTSTGSVTEDVNLTSGNLTANGTLAVTDVDSGQAAFAAPTTLSGAYGNFTFNTASGAWTYTASNNQSAIQSLRAGQSLTDSISVQSLDGTASQTLSVIINGTNDGPVAVADAKAATEDVTVSTTAATGVLANDTDVDSGDTKTVSGVSFGATTGTVGSALAGTYGTLTLNADGSYSYLADKAPAEALGAGQTATEIFTYTMKDSAGATSSTTLTFTINGSNDAPVISGVDTGAVVEAGGLNNATAGTPNAAGTLTISDADAGQSSFAAPPPASLNGTYGSFTFNNATGAWTYALDNSKAATQALAAGTTAHDTLSVTSADGTTSRVIDVTVTGANDTAVINGTSTGSMTEDIALTSGNLTASGALAVSDVDASQATFAAPTTLAGTYGNFTFDAATGAWTYAASNAQSAIQSLGAGQTLTDTIVVKSFDGSASQSITVTIHGTNDVAVIGGTAIGTMTEDTAVSAGNLVASGTLTASDVDAGEARFGTPATLAGTYGNFTFDTSTGAWTYAANNTQTAVQQLGVGQSLTDSITVKSLDGSASQNITVTINGTNDIATIAGTSTAVVTEDANVTAGNLTASGSLSVSDVDLGQNTFAAPATLAGSYGNFTFNAATGAWTYAANNSQSAIQSLGAGQSLTDSIVVKSLDGTASQTISVTINGTNDVPVIGGTSTGSVVEAGGLNNATAGTPTASGTLTIADGDAAQGSFQTPASLAGTYGNFTFNAATGAWTYALDNSKAATQALSSGTTVHDTLSVTSSDGTATQLIDVTVTGANDTAVITGSSTGSLTEDTALTSGNLTASGTLAVADVDSGQAAFAVPTTLAGAYGNFTFNTATGAWTYAANNAQSAIQSLGAGQSLTDSITVKSLDGSASQAITVTINGTNDVPVIGGTSTGSVVEAGGLNNATAGTPGTSGTLTISDADNGQSNFTAPPSLTGTYGNFTFNAATGAWTYTLDNTKAATQALTAGATVHDTLTVASSDGSASKLIDVTVTGANDTAVITGSSSGSVTEDTALTSGNLTASGTLAVADVDAGQATFTAPATLAGTYGSFTFNASTGAWTYAANNAQTAIQQLGAGQSLTDSITVQSADGTASQAITVTINGTNDGPVAVADAKAATEDITVSTTAATGVLANDTDVDNSDTKTVSGVAYGTTTGTVGSALAGNYGTLTLNADGSYSYLANKAPAEALGAGQTATETFAYTVRDAAGATSSTTLTFTITGTNDAAIISAPVINLTETNAALTTSGTLSITDIDSPATFVAQTNVAGSNGYGKFTLATNGAWTYTANTAHDEFVAGTTYTDTLTVTSADGTTSTITVNILGTNDAAVISAPVVNLTETNAALTTSGTLAITDVDNPLSFVAQPNVAGSNGYGKFTLATNGAWTYTANTAHDEFVAGATYTDTLTVTSADGTTSTITVNILGTNDAPTTTGGSVTGTEDTALVLNWSQFNVTDVDGGPAPGIVISSLPANGVLQYSTDGVTWTSISAAGQTVLKTNIDAGYLRFVPATNESGINAFGGSGVGNNKADYVNFNYQAVDGSGVNGTGNTGTLHVDITPVADAPTVSLSAGAPAFTQTSSASGVASGYDTYSVRLASALTDTDGSETLSNITLTGVPATVTFSAGTKQADGSWVLTQANLTGLTMTVPTGTAAFDLRAASTSTETANSSQATTSVTLHIEANHAPISVADTATATEAGGTGNGTAGVNPTGNVLTNDLVIDAADVKSVASVSAGSTSGTVGTALAGAYGSLTLNADGSYTYVVDNSNPTVQALRTSSNTLTDTFTYTNKDASGAVSAPTTLTVTIQGANDAPVAVNDVNAVLKNGTITAAAATGVLVNDTDVDTGDTKTVSGVKFGNTTGTVGSGLTGTYGTFTLAADGSYTYKATTAAAGNLGTNATGTDTFTYTVRDAAGLTSTATVVFTVTGSNHAPTAVGTTLSGTEDTPLTLSWANFGVSDADGINASTGIKIMSVPADGVLQTSTDGVTWTNITGTTTVLKSEIDLGHLRFVPDANESGSNVFTTTGTGNMKSDYASFTYQGTDGTANSATVTIKVDITPVADDAILKVGGVSIIDGATIIVTQPAGDGLTVRQYTNVPNISTTTVDTVAEVEQLLTLLNLDTPASTTISGAPQNYVPSTSGGDPSGIPTDGAYRMTGLIYMEAGHTYTFSSYMDDTALLVVGGTIVLEKQYNSWGNIAATTYAPTVSGYYTLDWAVYNGTSIGAVKPYLSVDGGTAQDLTSSNFKIYSSLTALENAGGIHDAVIGSATAGYYPVSNSGVEDTSIKISPIVIGLTDTDGSEAIVSLFAKTLLAGTVLSDGTNTFTATSTTTSVNITNWSLGTLTIKPPLNFSGSYNLTMELTSKETSTGELATNTVVLPIPVANVNDTPVAVADAASVTEDSGTYTIAGNVISNDTDADNDTLRVTAINAQTSQLGVDIAGSHGYFHVNADGSYTYALISDDAQMNALNAGQSLTDFVSYTIADPSGATSTGTLTVTINGATDAYSGASLITGSAAGDTLTGTAAADHILGLAGNDYMEAGSGHDLVETGDSATSSTVAQLNASTFMTTADASMLNASDQLAVADDANKALGDLANGGLGNDALTGTGGNSHLLYGGAGNDYLHGGTGSDALRGGAGNDHIEGGGGSDVLRGDSGADVFIWSLNDGSASAGTTAAAAGNPYGVAAGVGLSGTADLVMDFSKAEGDALDLRDVLVGESHQGLASGNLSNYLHFEASNGNTVVHVSTTGGFAGGTYNPASENQTIVLANVNLTQDNSGTTLLNDNAVIQDLLNNKRLIVD
ncbi:MAG TPA: VCBS domain-containing protein [Rhodocyclaceae bacterium]|nr:VCBS domain-containing protein [Rhodocyclaceae bacterium]